MVLRPMAGTKTEMKNKNRNKKKKQEENIVYLQQFY